MLEYGGRQTICPTLLTTEDLGDIEPRVLLGEEFPCTNDTIGRIDQSPVHVEETSIPSGDQRLSTRRQVIDLHSIELQSHRHLR